MMDFYIKTWRTGAVQIYMNLPQIPLIKIKNDKKAETYCVKIKLCRDPTSENLDLKRFKMALFGKGDPEEFLLFVQNFKMTLEALGKISANSNIQYLCTLLLGKSLRQFDTLCDKEGSMTTTHLN